MKARVEQAAAQLSSAKSQPDIQAAKNAEQEAKSAVAQVQASVRRAQMGVNQAIANRQNNELRKYDIDAAKASIARSQATLKNAEVTLNQTVVTAPENGVVLQKYVEQGTIITSGLSLSSTGTAIVQIGDVSRMYVNVTVDETDIASIEEGQTVDVSFDAYPGVPFEGKVTRVNPQATVLQNVTTVGVRVEVDNSSPSFRLLKPGMNAACDFVVDQKENVLTVPPDAVRSDDKGSYVDVATGGRPAPKTPDSVDGALVDVKKEHRSIEIGIEGNESVEVVKGLKAGEKVVAQEIAPVQANATGGSPFGGGGGRGGMGGGFGGGRGGR